VGATFSEAAIGGNRMFIIYDQSVASGATDATSIPSGATINSVYVQTTISNGQYPDPYMAVSTGNSYPYPSYATVPGKTVFNDIKTASGRNPVIGINNLNISGAGTISQWADAAAGTRYKGVIIANAWSAAYYQAGNLTVNYTVLE
jgi:hypothetical protein